MPDNTYGQSPSYGPSPIMQFFSYTHLPLKLQVVSAPIGNLAHDIDRNIPDGPQKELGLTLLLQAKDALVRALK